MGFDHLVHHPAAAVLGKYRVLHVNRVIVRMRLRFRDADDLRLSFGQSLYSQMWPLRVDGRGVPHVEHENAAVPQVRGRTVPLEVYGPPAPDAYPLPKDAEGDSFGTSGTEQVAQGFMMSKVLFSALEFGLFTELTKGSLDADELNEVRRCSNRTFELPARCW